MNAEKMSRNNIRNMQYFQVYLKHALFNYDHDFTEVPQEAAASANVELPFDGIDTGDARPS